MTNTASGFSGLPHPTETYREIPGDPGLPVIGNIVPLLRDPIPFLQQRYKKYGKISWTNAFGLRMIQMMGPEANQFVFQNRDSIFSNNQGWDYFIGKFFTRGIMLLDFEEHRHHRQIMQAAFKKPALVKYLDRMNPAIDSGITKWQPDNKFPILKNIKSLTLDLATDVFMGYHLGPEANAINKAFVDTVRAGSALVRHPVPGLRWKKGLDGRKVLEDFFKANLPAKKAGNDDDLFSQLCRAEDELGRRFSDEDIVNHMIFLMMAAHDTSTITLCSIFNQLARHPEWQDKVREESLRLGKRYLDHEDLDKMETMTWVMKEALRMIAPVPSIPRRTVKDAVFDGCFIPKGSMINVVPLFTHYMDEYWTNPEAFDPERFSDQRQEYKKHMYQYVPFGGGAHMCIGLHFADLQVKAILHQIVQKYRWSVEPGYDMPVDFTSLPVPADGLPVRFERL